MMDEIDAIGLLAVAMTGMRMITALALSTFDDALTVRRAVLP